MTPEQRRAGAQSETLVISRTEEGSRACGQAVLGLFLPLPLENGAADRWLQRFNRSGSRIFPDLADYHRSSSSRPSRSTLEVPIRATRPGYLKPARAHQPNLRKENRYVRSD